MAGPTVRLMVGKTEVELHEHAQIQRPQVVPAAAAVIAVEGARSRNALLDGRAVRLSSGRVGLLATDLTRSTGFHRLTVDERSFWFGTEDAKLRLDGVVAMLAELDTMGTGWTGQAVFSDGTGHRDPHVSYGWLDQWADLALAAASTVIENPRSQSTVTRSLRRRGGSGVLLAPTLRLLRSDLRRYLAETSAGVIVSGGRRFEPLRVVARTRTKTLDTIANRRAVAILGWVDRLAREVIAASSSGDAIARSRLWSNRARTLLRRPLAQALHDATLGSEQAQIEEATDAHYAQTYRVARDLSERFGWSATTEPQPRLSYIDQSDGIFQAYVASRLARELTLQQTSPVLGMEQPAFTGDRFDLYYDTIPPAAVLRSWRSYSVRPDESRPDLLLHERATGAVAVLDAKYRRARDGGASEDSRKDVSAYMALYGLPAVTILFPGLRDGVEVLEGRGQRIVEASIAPAVVDLSAAVREIEASLQTPPF